MCRVGPNHTRNIHTCIYIYTRYTLYGVYTIYGIFAMEITKKVYSHIRCIHLVFANPTLMVTHNFMHTHTRQPAAGSSYTAYIAAQHNGHLQSMHTHGSSFRLVLLNLRAKHQRWSTGEMSKDVLFLHSEAGHPLPLNPIGTTFASN